MCLNKQYIFAHIYKLNLCIYILKFIACKKWIKLKGEEGEQNQGISTQSMKKKIDYEHKGKAKGECRSRG